jgi:hypothetical protein
MIKFNSLKPSIVSEVDLSDHSSIIEIEIKPHVVHDGKNLSLLKHDLVELIRIVLEEPVNLLLKDVRLVEDIDLVSEDLHLSDSGVLDLHEKLVLLGVQVHSEFHLVEGGKGGLPGAARRSDGVLEINLEGGQDQEVGVVLVTGIQFEVHV